MATATYDTNDNTFEGGSASDRLTLSDLAAAASSPYSAITDNVAYQTTAGELTTALSSSSFSDLTGGILVLRNNDNAQSLLFTLDGDVVIGHDEDDDLAPRNFTLVIGPHDLNQGYQDYQDLMVEDAKIVCHSDLTRLVVRNIHTESANLNNPSPRSALRIRGNNTDSRIRVTILGGTMALNPSAVISGTGQATGTELVWWYPTSDVGVRDVEIYTGRIDFRVVGSSAPPTRAVFAAESQISFFTDFPITTEHTRDAPYIMGNAADSLRIRIGTGTDDYWLCGLRSNADDNRVIFLNCDGPDWQTKLAVRSHNKLQVVEHHITLDYLVVDEISDPVEDAVVILHSRDPEVSDPPDAVNITFPEANDRTNRSVSDSDGKGTLGGDGGGYDQAIVIEALGQRETGSLSGTGVVQNNYGLAANSKMAYASHTSLVYDIFVWGKKIQTGRSFTVAKSGEDGDGKQTLGTLSLIADPNLSAESSSDVAAYADSWDDVYDMLYDRAVEEEEALPLSVTEDDGDDEDSRVILDFGSRDVELIEDHEFEPDIADDLANLRGLAWNADNHEWAVVNVPTDSTAPYIRIYDHRGRRVGEFDLHGSNGDPVGITWATGDEAGGSGSSGDGGRYYVLDRTDRRVYVYDLEGERQQSDEWTITYTSASPLGIAWNSDDDRFAIVHGDQMVTIYDADGETQATEDFDAGGAAINPRGIVWRGPGDGDGGGESTGYYVIMTIVATRAYTSDGTRTTSEEWDIPDDLDELRGFAWDGEGGGGETGARTSGGHFAVLSNQPYVAIFDDDGERQQTELAVSDDSVTVPVEPDFGEGDKIVAITTTGTITGTNVRLTAKYTDSAGEHPVLVVTAGADEKVAWFQADGTQIGEILTVPDDEDGRGEVTFFASGGSEGNEQKVVVSRAGYVPLVHSIDTRDGGVFRRQFDTLRQQTRSDGSAMGESETSDSVTVTFDLADLADPQARIEIGDEQVRAQTCYDEFTLAVGGSSEDGMKYLAFGGGIATLNRDLWAGDALHLPESVQVKRATSGDSNAGVLAIVTAPTGSDPVDDANGDVAIVGGVVLSDFAEAVLEDTDIDSAESGTQNVADALTAIRDATELARDHARAANQQTQQS